MSGGGGKTMALPMNILAGLLMVSSIHASDIADGSKNHGFLSKHMPSRSEFSMSSTDVNGKFMANHLNHMELGGRPAALSHLYGFADIATVTGGSSYPDGKSKGGEVLVTPADDSPYTSHGDEPVHPTVHKLLSDGHIQDTMDFTSARAGTFRTIKDFEPKKFAGKGEDKAVEQLLTNENTKPVGCFAIGFTLLSFAAMVGVRMRRGLQPAIDLATSGQQGIDMSRCMVTVPDDQPSKVERMSCEGSIVQHTISTVGLEQCSSCGPPAVLFIAPKRPTAMRSRQHLTIDEEASTSELDWRAFRAKLEGAGLDATAREAWSDHSWAHALPEPEAGGLLLALPFSTTLCHAASPWYEDVRKFSSRKRWATERALNVPASHLAPSDLESASRRHRRAARRFAEIELKRVTEAPPQARTLRDRLFLADREAAIKRARNVVLVLALDASGGGTCLRLGSQDRGAPWGSRRRSAALFAALEADGGGFPDFHEFQAAFGSEVTVYTGSRAWEDWESVGWQGEAILLHMRAGLDGAAELAPGCGIYRGGAASAARLVANGDADAAEFSFFVGLYEFGPGGLRDAVGAGLYQPAACASALVLGDLGEASLWHDLMRKLGGANADIEMLAPKLPVCRNMPVHVPDESTFGDS